MHIAFLLHNAYAMGGTVRTTFTLAQSLAKQHGHRVELVSVFRHQEEPQLGRVPGIPLHTLVDRRQGSPDLADPQARQPGKVFPRGDSRAERYHPLAELRIVGWLAETDADFVVSTRAGLNVLLARFGPERAIRVGQEHLTYDNHPHRLRVELQRWYGGLDAVVTMTDADSRAHRRGLRIPDTRVVSVPNSIPEPGLPPADGESKIVLAAGRLARVKRFGMLVDAFALATAELPDWSLRIYGDGAERERIADRVRHHGLHNRVLPMGSAAPIEAQWVKGSIAAVASAQESFGMTIVEAMRCGLPVVSTDCPHGPGEIIRDGVDGLLVPRDDTRALAAALRHLMNDREQRIRMGMAARESAQRRFDPVAVADRYQQLITELAELADGRRKPRRFGRAAGQWTVAVSTARILARGALRRARRLVRHRSLNAGPL